MTVGRSACERSAATLLRRCQAEFDWHQHVPCAMPKVFLTVILKGSAIPKNLSREGKRVPLALFADNQSRWAVWCLSRWPDGARPVSLSMVVDTRNALTATVTLALLPLSAIRTGAQSYRSLMPWADIRTRAIAAVVMLQVCNHPSVASTPPTSARTSSPCAPANSMAAPRCGSRPVRTAARTSPMLGR
jgi:hypothetical protein